MSKAPPPHSSSGKGPVSGGSTPLVISIAAAIFTTPVLVVLGIAGYLLHGHGVI